jgi:hypothetical protein
MKMFIPTFLVATATCVGTAAPAFAQLLQPASDIGGAYDQRIIREVIVNGHFSNADPYSGIAIELPRDTYAWPN